MDFRFIGGKNGIDAVGVVKDVKAGAASTIKTGDLVIPDDGNPGYVRKVATGETSATATRVYFAVSASNETVGADGTVKLLYGPNMILAGTATTPANLVQAVIDTKVTVDVTTGTITIDENDTTNGFLRIARPADGVAGFDTTNGYDVAVICNE